MRDPRARVVMASRWLEESSVDGDVGFEGAVAMRAATRARTRTYGTFDTIKSWLAGGVSGAARSMMREDLSLNEFVALLERAEKERASGEGGAHAESREMTSAEISFPATRARAIVDDMTEAEMKAPNETTLARRRELGAREEVDELIKAHALTRAIARRMKGLDTMPTSPEALAEALKRGDGSMSREARRAEAAAMRGAFPGNRPCPCGSTKKFKRCCGA